MATGEIGTSQNAHKQRARGGVCVWRVAGTYRVCQMSGGRRNTDTELNGPQYQLHIPLCVSDNGPTLHAATGLRIKCDLRISVIYGACAASPSPETPLRRAERQRTDSPPHTSTQRRSGVVGRERSHSGILGVIDVAPHAVLAHIGPYPEVDYLLDRWLAPSTDHAGRTEPCATLPQHLPRRLVGSSPGSAFLAWYTAVLIPYSALFGAGSTGHTRLYAVHTYISTLSNVYRLPSLPYEYPISRPLTPSPPPPPSPTPTLFHSPPTALQPRGLIQDKCHPHTRSSGRRNTAHRSRPGTSVSGRRWPS